VKEKDFKKYKGRQRCKLSFLIRLIVL